VIRLVQELAADGFSGAVTCRVLEVAPSTYYEAISRVPSARKLEDRELMGLIVEVHEDSCGPYGAPRVHAEMRMGLGLRIGRKRVARLMRGAGIRGVSHRRKTRHRPDTATHDDLVQRRFTADGPDRVWFTDITQHRAADGWVYCCAVVDAWSRMVVGWSIADHVRSELVVDALEMARWQRSPAGTVVHADRGAQYTSWVFGHRLRSAGLLGSMGRVASSGRQHAHRVVLVDHAARAPRPPHVDLARGTRLGDLRMDRRLVQPPSPSHQHGEHVPARLRNPAHRRDRRGMIT